MKELDVLLERFVHRALHRLADGEVEALERLLEQPDRNVLAWIVSAQATAPPDLAGVVELIRLHAIGRPCRGVHPPPRSHSSTARYTGAPGQPRRTAP